VRPFGALGRGLLIDITPLRGLPDFRFLWQLATRGGRAMVSGPVPYQIYLTTHSLFAVGLVGLFEAVPGVLAGLYGGGLTDRLDSRSLQLVTTGVVAITSISLAVGAIDHGDPVLLVSLIVALSAAASVVDQSARTATVPRLVSRRMLASASSLTGSAHRRSSRRTYDQR